MDEACRDVGWELDTARTFAMWSLMYRGEVAEMRRRQPKLLRVATENNDLFAVLNFGTIVMAHLRLADDQTAEAQRQLEEDRSRLSKLGFFVQHHNWLLAKTFVELYAGNPLIAWNVIADAWPKYRISMLGLVQQVRVDFLQTQGRAAVAAAAAAPGGDRPSFVRRARSIIRKLNRERSAWADGTARALEAGLHALSGDAHSAASCLEDAAERFRRTDMLLFSAAARRQMGELRDRADIVNQADALMANLGIVNGSRMAATLIPCTRPIS